MSEEDYRRLTYDLTIAVARQFLPGNPRMIFEYISGEGTDANSRQTWARVQAETEAAVCASLRRRRGVELHRVVHWYDPCTIHMVDSVKRPERIGV